MIYSRGKLGLGRWSWWMAWFKITCGGVWKRGVMNEYSLCTPIKKIFLQVKVGFKSIQRLWAAFPPNDLFILHSRVLGWRCAADDAKLKNLEDTLKNHAPTNTTTSSGSAFEGLKINRSHWIHFYPTQFLSRTAGGQMQISLCFNWCSVFWLGASHCAEFIKEKKHH